jgi:hypothetical protein
MENPIVEVTVIDVKEAGVKKLSSELEAFECQALLVSSSFGAWKKDELVYYVVLMRGALHSRKGETYMNKEKLKASRKFHDIDHALDYFAEFACESV